MKLAVLYILLVSNFLNILLRGFTLIDYKLHPDLLRIVVYPNYILVISFGISVLLLIILQAEIRKAVCYVKEFLLDVESSPRYKIGWLSFSMCVIATIFAIILPEIHIA